MSDEHSRRTSRTALDGQVHDALAALRRHWSGEADVGLILGTGCGDVADQIEAEAVVPYEQIPHLPCSTALAHRGRLVCGRLAGTRVMAMQGRCHLYEGYTVDEITLGVRLMHAAGAGRLILSNAAGGMNHRYAGGDIVVMDGHVNLMWHAPRRLCSDPPPGLTRGGEVYDDEMIEHALAIARREDFAAHRGVYVAVSGPNYETRAEYRCFRRLGDVVGMSTVPEALVAAECGMRVLALSLVTNVARPDAPERVDAEDVVAVARGAEPKLRRIVIGVCAKAESRSAE